MLRLASRGLARSVQRGAVLQQSRRCLVTKFSKVRARLQQPIALPSLLHE